MTKKIFLYFSFLALFLGLCPIKTNLVFNNFNLVRVAHAQGKEKSASVDKDKKEKIKAGEEKSGQVKKAKSSEGALFDDYKAPKAEELSYGWLFIKTLFVLGLFGAGFYFFFRFVTKKMGVPRIGSSIVQMLSISPIGQGKFIQVVEVGGKILVLGITDNNISLISEITEKDEIDRIKLNSSKSTSTKEASFQDFIKDKVGHLSDFLNKNKKSEKTKLNKMNKFGNQDEKVRLDYLKQQKERLKKLNGFHDE